MMSELPRGKAEDENLEFKHPDALNDLDELALDLVAFLNRATDIEGQLWIGIAEDRAKGTPESFVAVRNAQRRIEALRNHWVDKIEPVPTESELRPEAVALDSGGHVVCIHVRGDSKRGPYAFLGKQNSRRFVRRVHARRANIDRADLEAAFRHGADKPAASELWQTARTTAERFFTQSWVGSEATLQIALVPLASEREELIDLDDVALKELLADPHRDARLARTLPILPAGAVRREDSSWISEVRLLPPRVGIERKLSGELTPEQEFGFARYEGRESDTTRTRVDRSGAIFHSSPLFRLRAGSGPSTVARQLDPLEAIELIVYFTRFASVVYRDQPKPLASGPRGLLAAIRLRNAHDWILLPGERGTARYIKAAAHAPARRKPALDQVGPLEWRMAEIVERPDSCAWRIIERLYGDVFGLALDEIPDVFDPIRREYRGPTR
jgi:hypothetical protein